MFLQKGDTQVLLPGKWRQDQVAEFDHLRVNVPWLLCDLGQVETVAAPTKQAVMSIK